MASVLLRRRARVALPMSMRFLSSSSSSSSSGAELCVDAAGPGSVATDATSSNLWSIMRPPVNALTALLDGLHSATGAPWWLVLAGSTFAMKAALFPLTVLQLQKLAEFAQFTRKFPVMRMPGSKKSLGEHYKEFTQKRKEFGAPSPAWFFASPVLQVPLFITCLLTVRSMAINKHPGFSSGGILWFTDLTAPVQEHAGVIFPVLVVVTYFANIEASWKNVNATQNAGPMGSFITTYRWWLRGCSLPLFVSSFYFPQAVFMYWIPNSLSSLIQTLVLQNERARANLGLPSIPNKTPLDSESLIKAAAELVAKNERKKAVQILQFVAKKDPENPTPYYALAKMHSESELWGKAAELYRLAAEKAKRDDLRIGSYLGLGIALRNQGELIEAKDTLKAVAELQVPDDQGARKSYLMALVSLASILNHEGQKLEALQYLEKASEYDPVVAQVYVKQVKEEVELENSQPDEQKPSCSRVHENQPKISDNVQVNGP